MIVLTGRSREGAWIEIATVVVDSNGMPGRSREGAWIEMPYNEPINYKAWSLPRGSVD